MPDRRKGRVFAWLVWTAVALSLSAVVLVGAGLNQTVRSESEKAFVNNLKFLAESSGKSTQLFMESVVSEVVLLIEIDAVKKYKTDLVDFAFRGIIEKHGELVSHWGLIDGAGKSKVMVSRIGVPEPQPETLAALYDETLNHWRVNIDDTAFVDGPIGGIAVSVPIWRKMASPAASVGKVGNDLSWIYPSGMIMAIVNGHELVKNFVDLSKVDEGGAAWIVTDHGKLLADQDRLAGVAARLCPRETEPLARLTADFTWAREGKTPTGWTFLNADRRVAHIDTGEEEWFIATAPLTLVEHEWTMALAAPQSEVTRLINQSFWQSAVLFFIVVGVMVTGAWFLTFINTRMARAEEKALLAAELEEKNRSLAELNRRMDEFVSVVSHDIRSPLNVIRGLAKMIADDDAGKEHFSRETDTMLRSCNRLMQLVNDILDVSKLEAGKMRLSPDPLVIDDLINEGVATMRHTADEKRQKIVVDLGEPTPMEGDVSKLLQVINNLLGNAIKFSSQGIITVTKRLEADRVTVTVTDTGPGIPIDQQAAVFDRFEQLKTHRQGFEPGSGLGLAICKGVAELHSGAITVESEPGHGSSFILRLPLKQKNLP